MLLALPPKQLPRLQLLVPSCLQGEFIVARSACHEAWHRVHRTDPLTNIAAQHQQAQRCQLF